MTDYIRRGHTLLKRTVHTDIGRMSAKAMMPRRNASATSMARSVTARMLAERRTRMKGVDNEAN